MSQQQTTRPGQSQKYGQKYAPWLSLVLISTLLYLASCASLSFTTQHQVTPTPAAKVKKTPTKPALTASPSSVTPTPTQSPTNFFDEISLLHHLLSPQGWMWRVSLPTDRLVVYYGNPFSSAMGPLGSYSDGELLAKLRKQAQAYADLDAQHPIIPA